MLETRSADPRFSPPEITWFKEGDAMNPPYTPVWSAMQIDQLIALTKAEVDLVPENANCPEPVDDPDGVEIWDILESSGLPFLLSSYFLDCSKKLGQEIIVHSPDQSKAYSYIDPNADDHFIHLNKLVISDPNEFAESLHLLFIAFCNLYLSHCKGELGQYVSKRLKQMIVTRFWDIFSDSPTDELDWKNLFNRRLEELKRGTLQPCDQVQICEKDDRKLEVVNQTTIDGMEGYFKLDGTYSWGRKKMRLASTRYGVISDREAIIYAVQSPIIRGHSSATIKTKIRKNQWRKEEMEKIFSSNPELQDLLEDGELSDQALMDLFEKYGDKTVSYLRVRAVTLMDALMVRDYYREYLCRIEEVEEINKLHKHQRRSVNAMNGKLKSELLNTWNIPAHSFLSFIATLKQMHRKGIREVKVQMKFSYRTHPTRHQDERIRKGKIDLCASVANEIFGISLTGDPKKDNFLSLHLEEEIAPKSSIVTDLWNLIS